MKIRAISTALALGIAALWPGVAQAEFVEQCLLGLNGAAAGTGASAVGSASFQQDESLGQFRVVFTHNVIAPSEISIRTGTPGNTSTNVLSNLGGNTASSFTYVFTSQEVSDIAAAGLDWYIMVANALGPAPGGLIRADRRNCNAPVDGEDPQDGEAGSDEIPEGWDDYACNINLSAAQVPGGSSSTLTATAEWDFVGANTVQLLFRLFGVTIPEEVTNGDFENNPTSQGWTLPSGWNVGSRTEGLGTFHFAQASNTSNDLSQNNVFDGSSIYVIRYTVTATAGTVQMRAGSAASTAVGPVHSAGTTEESVTVEVAATGPTLVFDATNFSGEIDGITVKLRRRFSLHVHSGEPGATGPEVYQIGDNVNPALQLTWNAAQLEDYTSTPHYLEVRELPATGDTQVVQIRGDIVGCQFDDGVSEEGEAEEGEAGLEGEADLDCLASTPQPTEVCFEELSGALVDPPNSSTNTGNVQIIEPSENNFFLIVRHNVPNPTSIIIYQGAPGTTGLPFLAFGSGLTCPFVQGLSSNFFTVLKDNPMYVEVANGNPADTIRADLICAGAIEGETEAAVDGEGGGADGEGDGDGEGGGGGLTLRAIAEFLLLAFNSADGSNNDALEFAEAQSAVPQMTAEQFLEMDSDDDEVLLTGELHRYAGPVRKHNADVDGDGVFSFEELIRLIQLYNAAAYSCNEPAGDTEDGFKPGSGATTCERHASDYRGGGGNFRIDLSELLRGVQIYSFGSYTYCPSLSEDAYCIQEEIEGAKDAS